MVAVRSRPVEIENAGKRTIGDEQVGLPVVKVLQKRKPFSTPD